MNFKKLESYLRVNLLGPGPCLIKKDLPGRGLTKVEKHCCTLLREVLLKEIYWYVEHNNLLLCMVDSNKLHVSTLYAAHIQAFTKMIP